MTIEELARTKAKSLPNSQLVKYYEAAIPQYHINSILVMQKTKKISVLQEFVLKFVAAGVNDVSEIKDFLGVNTNVINNTVAMLQANGMLSVDVFKSTLKLTEKGEHALQEASMIVPEDIEYPLFVDGLTKRIYLDGRPKYKQNQIKKLNLKAIIPCVETPTIMDLPYEEVKTAIASFKKIYAYAKDRLEGELQEIMSIEKPYIEYNKVSVLVFMNKKNNDEIELQVYDGSSRNQDYETALTKLYNNQTRVFDFDKKRDIDNNKELPLQSILPKEIIDSAKEYSSKTEDLEKEIGDLTSQLADVTDELNDVDGPHDNEAKEKIRFLEEKIEELKSEQKSSNRILSTYDHRPLLIQALTDARKSIVIISPWIKASGLNGQIISLMNNALARKVRIVIGYGISEKEDSDPYIIDQLTEMQKKFSKFLILRNLANTHEKVLIKDDDYMVITSFNWLSFRGDPNLGFRQETGFYTEAKECIADMKKNLSQPQRLGIQL